MRGHARCQRGTAYAMVMNCIDFLTRSAGTKGLAYLLTVFLSGLDDIHSFNKYTCS